MLRGSFPCDDGEDENDPLALACDRVHAHGHDVIERDRHKRPAGYLVKEAVALLGQDDQC